jgi:hypothetical protein
VNHKAVTGGKRLAPSIMEGDEPGILVASFGSRQVARRAGAYAAARHVRKALGSAVLEGRSWIGFAAMLWMKVVGRGSA